MAGTNSYTGAVTPWLQRVSPTGGVGISHRWQGNVGMSRDRLAHMGTRDGVRYGVVCNGSGVAMMSYLGTQTARKITGRQNRPGSAKRWAIPVRTSCAMP